MFYYLLTGVLTDFLYCCFYVGVHTQQHYSATHVYYRHHSVFAASVMLSFELFRFKCTVGNIRRDLLAKIK